MPQKPCRGRNYPPDSKSNFGQHFANIRLAGSSQNTHFCTGKGHPQELFLSPDWCVLQPGFPGIIIRCTRCIFFFLVRMLQTSLRNSHFVNILSSRISQHQCNEARRAVSSFLLLYQSSLLGFVGKIHSSCFQPPILPINKTSQDITHVTFGVWAFSCSWGCWQGLSCSWKWRDGHLCWNWRGFSGWSPLLEEKAALLPGESIPGT